MGYLKHLLLAFFVLALAVITFFFVTENQQPASLIFLGWVTPAVPLAVIAMVALLAGLVIGPLIALFIILRAKVSS